MHATRSDNMGVGALSVSEVDIIRDIASQIGHAIEITVVDFKDKRDPYVTGPDIKVVDLDGKMMRNPKGFFAIARSSDLMIDIGGGDSFADIYGPRRINRMFFLKYVTHIARTPLVMAPQTIGPFSRPASKWLARLSMRLCKVVASRDAKSTAAARDLGCDKVIEACDVAMRLPYDPPAPREGGPVKVGINVSGLLMGGGYTGKNEFDLQMDYPSLMRELITWFQDHSEGCEVHLIPHVIVREGKMVGEDDYTASQKLVEEFPEAVLAPAFNSPSEAKSYIAGMDFFMGARMHACIGAFAAGVPVVPMAYSRKFEGLFGTLGYGYTVDCTSQSAADIRAAIEAGFANRDTLAAEAKVAYAKGREKLAVYENALRDTVQDIVAKL
jgi:polysaccharide pyruvyl transferase WcaK-like protein